MSQRNSEAVPTLLGCSSAGARFLGDEVLAGKNFIQNENAVEDSQAVSSPKRNHILAQPERKVVQLHLCEESCHRYIFQDSLSAKSKFLLCLDAPAGTGTLMYLAVQVPIMCGTVTIF